MRVNMYAREANELAQELRVDAQYSVTLQIPSSNLSPNRRVSNTCSYSQNTHTISLSTNCGNFIG
mgnify:FL=1